MPKKPCPHCGRAISDEAIICRYCSRWVDPAVQQRIESMPKKPKKPLNIALFIVAWYALFLCVAIYSFMEHPSLSQLVGYLVSDLVIAFLFGSGTYFFYWIMWGKKAKERYEAEKNKTEEGE